MVIIHFLNLDIGNGRRKSAVAVLWESAIFESSKLLAARVINKAAVGLPMAAADLCQALTTEHTKNTEGLAEASGAEQTKKPLDEGPRLLKRRKRRNFAKEKQKQSARASNKDNHKIMQ